MEDVVARLEAVCKRLEGAANNMGGKAELDADVLPEYVDDWNRMCAKEGKAVCDAFDKLTLANKNVKDAPRTEFSEIFSTSMNNITKLLSVAHKVKKPSQADAMKFLGEYSQCFKTLDKLNFAKRKADPFMYDAREHLNTLKELIQAFQWVITPVEGVPAAVPKNMGESCIFRCDKMNKNFKDDEKKAGLALRKCLTEWNKAHCEYVNANFKMGLEYNPKGEELSGAKVDAPVPGAAPAKSAEKKAPAKKKPAKKKAAGDLNLAAALNIGGAVTSGLKKVDKSMKTKYRKERVGKVTIKTKKALKKKLPDPKKVKRGFTWQMSYYVEGVNTWGEDDGLSKKMGAYFTQCFDCGLIIDTKCKAAVIDSCKKVKVQVMDVISTVEIVNSQSVTLYCKGIIPSITLDKCSSVTIVLCPEAVKKDKDGKRHLPSVITSCTTASNLEFWSDPDSYESESITIPFAEQFENNLDLVNGKIIVTPVDHGD